MVTICADLPGLNVKSWCRANRWWGWGTWIALLCLGISAGCERGIDRPRGTLEAKTSTLQVAVSGSPLVAAAIEEAGSEWTARRGTRLQVTALSAAASGTEILGADVIFCTPVLLGELVASGDVRGVPSAIWESEELASRDFWPLASQTAVWDHHRFGIPLAERVLFCYLRRDLLDQVGHDLPRTWDQYGEAALALREHSTSRDDASNEWWPALEPLAPQWAGISLLARAAPYAKHPHYYSVLFEADTMEPRIGGPPFVRALDEMRRALLARGLPPRMTPDEVHGAFLAGKCGLAIAWPPSVPYPGPDRTRESLWDRTWGVIPLPGATQVFHPAGRHWEARGGPDAGRVPLLGMGGMVACVSAKSHRAGASFQLLAWLCGSQWGPRIAAADPALQPARLVGQRGDSPWPAATIPPAVAEAFRAALRETMLARDGFFIPLIPGRADYITALDEAVWACLEGRATPEEALEQAVNRWRGITAGLGASRQAREYRRSLGRSDQPGSF